MRIRVRVGSDPAATAQDRNFTTKLGGWVCRKIHRDGPAAAGGFARAPAPHWSPRTDGHSATVRMITVPAWRDCRRRVLSDHKGARGSGQFAGILNSWELRIPGDREARANWESGDPCHDCLLASSGLVLWRGWKKCERLRAPYRPGEPDPPSALHRSRPSPGLVSCSLAFAFVGGTFCGQTREGKTG
jgi:hypothetical protein